MVIWLIGLSGSGKTTLGSAIANAWRERSPGTVLIDGDVIRRALTPHEDDTAYTVTGRRENAERITALCEWLDAQSINVVCCILSIFPQMRAQNRARFSRYYEVYLRAPIDVLAQRDRKSLYGPALRGERANVVGVDIPFPEPQTPDLTLDTAGAPPNMQQLALQVLSEAKAW